MPVEEVIEPKCEETSVSFSRRLKNRAWPVALTFLTASFLPARTAERTQHVRLLKAWGIHILTFALAMIGLFVFLIVMMVAGTDPSPSVVSACSRLFREVSRDAVRHPLEFWGAVAGIFAGVEAGFIVLALLVGPWGARVEPLRATIASALRRTWLHTPHAALCLLLGCLLALFIYKNKVQWRVARMPPVSHPRLKALSHNATPQEIKAYATEIQKYNDAYGRAMDAIRPLEPFYVRYDDELVAIMSLTLGVWFLWGLMRAIGAPRISEQKLQPPLCEFCGYNLTTMPESARCPECGEFVVASLGPNVRPGTLWQRRKQNDRVVAYFKTLAMAVLRPAQLGRQIRLYKPGTDHRALLTVHCLLIGLLGLSMPVLAMIWNRNWKNFDLRREFFHETAFVGFAFGGITFGVLLLSAGFVGLICSLLARRNLLPAAIQAVSYLSGFVVLGVLFGFVNVAVLDARTRELRDMAQSMHIDMFTVAIALFFVPNLLWVAWLQYALYRATWAARFANR